MFSGMQGSTSATQSDAIAAANMSDIVSGLTVQIKQYGAAMRQANPNVQLYLYVNGELAQSKDCSTFPASWYLYSTGGAKVKSPNGNCAMYPLSTQTWNGYAGWIDYVKHLCAQNLAQAPLANGCFVDQISSALNSSWASALPIDPATKKVYAMSTWMGQMGQIGQTIEQFTGKPVIGNSYEGGARYWGMPTNLINGYGIDSFESEHFLNANKTQWTKQSYWTKNIDMMIDAQSKGKRINVGFTDAPTTNEETWRQFATASYLLGNNGNAWLAFCSTAKHSYTDPSPAVWPADRLADADGDVGVRVPGGARCLRAEVHRRHRRCERERIQRDGEPRRHLQDGLGIIAWLGDAGERKRRGAGQRLTCTAESAARRRGDQPVAPPPGTYLGLTLS